MSNYFTKGIYDQDDTPEFNLVPDISEFASDNEMLDYMVLVLTRRLTSSAAFKGGYLLTKLLKNSRLTGDIDLSIGDKDSYAEVKEVLKDIAEIFKSKGLIDTYKIKEEIFERMSGGIDFYDATGKKVLGADIGLHDISFGVRHYDLKFTEVQGFKVERMLSDKVSAILSRKRFRRAKDLYDFYCLVSTFDVDYNLIAECLSHRENVEWQNIPFDAKVLVEYKKAWDKLSLINARTGRNLDKPDFEKIIDLFVEFCEPLKYNEQKTLWNHEECEWND